MSAFSNAIRTPFGIILPLREVRGRAIVDALDKCGVTILSQLDYWALGEARSIGSRGRTLATAKGTGATVDVHFAS